jgi:UMF1 family MFS transporter
MKTVLLFLCAYWLYIDGVDTIIRMAVDYGMSLGFAANDLLLALLVTQFVGFPAALVFGRLGQRLGPRKGIYIAIGVYVAATFWGINMTRKEEFYVLAVVIGLVQGGIQALSRSYYARLIPADKPAEFFGFYNMLGKFAAIIGPGAGGRGGAAHAPDTHARRSHGRGSGPGGCPGRPLEHGLGADPVCRRCHFAPFR